MRFLMPAYMPMLWIRGAKGRTPDTWMSYSSFVPIGSCIAGPSLTRFIRAEMTEMLAIGIELPIAWRRMGTTKRSS